MSSNHSVPAISILTSVFEVFCYTHDMKKVESAGGVIINDADEVVVVYTDTHSWQFPKGTVEENERYFDTALREIEEETGLVDLEYIKDLPVYSRVSTHEENTEREIHYFLFKTKRLDLNPSAEVTQCKWIPLQDVERQLTYSEDKEFIKQVMQQGLLAVRDNG